MLLNIHAAWQKQVDIATKSDKTSVGSIAFQPLPRHVIRETERRGGTPMNFKEELGDHIIIEMDISWTKGRFDKQIYDAGTGITAQIDSLYQTKFKGQKATNMKQLSVLDQSPISNTTAVNDGYLPIFANDATWDQGVYRSYKDYEKLGQIQKKYDPNGFFSKRTNGWRFS
jgi:hypothetical protein